MKHPKIPFRTVSMLLALVLVAAVAGAIYATNGSTRAANAPILTVGPATVGRPIPPGFVGLATEYRGLEPYAGTNPTALDPVFEQLVRNLAPGQSPILRIGGDSTDWTWFPVAHLARPPGVTYTLTKSWMNVASALAGALDARLILGINFEADSGPVAAGEAQALIGTIGRGHIDALELGNEPELYGSFPWYKLPNGQHVRGRPSTYSYGDYVHDFADVAASLPRDVTLAGPSVGGPLWIPVLGQFLTVNKRVGLATLHRYPLKHCSSAGHVTVPDVLSTASSTGLAATVANAARTAHGHGVLLRIDEMSAISCGGVPGVSDSFATALWSLDTLFAMARVGVDGVNLQTAPGSWNELFAIDQGKGGWRAAVHPAYYGLMMFAQAAPPGARLLRLSGAPGPDVSAWATRAPTGEVRVVLINHSTSRARVVALRTPAMKAGGAPAPATIERMRAPSAYATGGVTLGGQSFGAETGTGQLAGPGTVTNVNPAGGAYTVALPAASAALITISAG